MVSLGAAAATAAVMVVYGQPDGHTASVAAPARSTRLKDEPKIRSVASKVRNTSEGEATFTESCEVAKPPRDVPQRPTAFIAALPPS
jgi:hypothetical protein